MPSGEGNQKIFRIEFAARAKAAADFRLYKVNAALRQTDELGKNAPIGMGHLGRTPHVQETATFVPLGHQTAIFERHGRMALGRKFLLDD
jgi:hypothetical protein